MFDSQQIKHKNKVQETDCDRQKQTGTGIDRHRQIETHRNFPVLLCTTKLAQSTSQYYFIYYKARTKYFPVLLRTTKLAQSTSQYYFVRQSSHKALPSTTSYYQACNKVPVPLRTTKLATKYFPVLLRTTKSQQSTSQYDFVLQSLHKVLQKSQFYLSV